MWIIAVAAKQTKNTLIAQMMAQQAHSKTSFRGMLYILEVSGLWHQTFPSNYKKYAWPAPIGQSTWKNKQKKNSPKLKQSNSIMIFPNRRCPHLSVEK